MSVVVRCPGCRGAARVGPEAVGLVVACPRCREPFLAVEDVAPVAPGRPGGPGRSAAPPVAPPGERPAPRGWAEPVAPPPDDEDEYPPPPRRRRRDEPAEAAHDHAGPPAGGLPTSVLVGLALLPFMIPLVWLIAPLVVGQPPVLSLAAPTALAVAASALCLAVVYTVDWSPATRIKGVLMLVGLSYFAGLSLYFLKQNMVERVKAFFGPDREWKEVAPQDRSYRVRMPRNVAQTQDQPMPGWPLACYRGSEKHLAGAQVVLVAGAGKDPSPDRPNDEWLDEAGRAVFRGTGAQPGRLQPLAGEPITHQGFPGRQWEVQVPGANAIRIVRVYRAEGTVYYLSAEGPNLTRDDALAQTFFQSFLATPRKD